MYPEKIETYNTRKEFEDHKAMLFEMKTNFEQTGASLSTFESIRKEEAKLAKRYNKWLKTNQQNNSNNLKRIPVIEQKSATKIASTETRS